MWSRPISLSPSVSSPERRMPWKKTIEPLPPHSFVLLAAAKNWAACLTALALFLTAATVSPVRCYFRLWLLSNQAPPPVATSMVFECEIRC